jgi:hypothetical protein
MKRAFIALCLALSLLLTGCLSFLPGSTRFEDMAYVRPDITAMEETLEKLENVIPTATSAKQIMDAFWPFYNLYEAFATAYHLSFAHYAGNMKDIYWSEEYLYCMENSAWVESAYDQLLYDLADSPLREALEGDDYFGADFFDPYEGDSLWDETLLALTEKESEILGDYYDLSAQPGEYTDAYFSSTGAELEQVFLELIQVRREIAEYTGYESYVNYAYEQLHFRDYTPEQTAGYLAGVRQELVPLYRQLPAAPAAKPVTEQENLQYLDDLTRDMGGVIRQAYLSMTGRGLYDISPGKNKYPASFELYIYSYQAPYLFLNPTGQTGDQFALIHEFGHFCNDYASYGTYAGADVVEVFSQGLEYLSLFYGQKDPQLETYKLRECLEIFVIQSAYADFEHQVYDLEDATTEDVRALYAQVLQKYGLCAPGWDSREYVMIPHFFTSPMYIVGYIFSNDAALQLYQMEAANKTSGTGLYTMHLSTQEQTLLSFLESAHLESPFAEGRLAKIRATLEEKLFPNA